ncbi:DNA cytosine methyltransferase [Natranaeroarchaeum aerophilus]|uniref:DNA (cytosine-5-)-methyltransferase n=1 Tax=Natranaeroarchaeum aerophilus TaxID=2917711 RepID=A0AAE3K6F8_9EURY|nr:DNA cytosine methyltransferase [Natranaeroarchaeum aerophilus]MCL9814360.1 DNA cytosine methyltransferase [Natranaeroarchaeum aerophilus]
MTDDRLTAIDLFCGAGGLSQGLSDAGFETLWGIDHEKNTKPTYEANHGCEMTVGDIREEEPPDLGLEKGELDLVAGGPPCPTFSLVGKSKINSLEGRDNQSDERHLLYEEFLRFVDHYQPKAFLMENVEGMLSAENENDEPVVKTIKEQMRGERQVADLDLDLNYTVRVQLLDAADFGVPQHRKRLFFIGNRIGADNPDMVEWQSHRSPRNEEEKKIKYKQDPSKRSSEDQHTLEGFVEEEEEREFPTFRKDIDSKEPWNTVADAILDLPPVSPDGNTPPTKAEEYELGPISEYQYWARNLEEEADWEDQPLLNHECRGHNMRDLTLYKLLGEGTSYIIGDIPEEHQPYRTDIFPDKLKKQNPKEPATTIVAHLYKDGHMFIHPNEARSITVREAARLQSFKDTFEFPVARTHAFKQVGNAVPPLLAQALGTAIRAEIFDRPVQEQELQKAD